MKIESTVKTVYSSQTAVYGKLSDLSNLSTFIERIKDPSHQDQLRQNLSDDQIEKAMKAMEGIKVDSNSVSVNIDMLGEIAMEIVDRDEPKCVKYASTKSPIAFTIWVQLLPLTDSSCKMKITADPQVNPFMRMMVEKPLKEGIERIADMLSQIRYE